MKICLTQSTVEWKSFAVYPTCIAHEMTAFINRLRQKTERVRIYRMLDLERDCRAAQVEINVALVTAVDPSSCSRLASKAFMPHLFRVGKLQRVIMAEMLNLPLPI
jgi:hypothetical protein